MGTALPFPSNEAKFRRNPSTEPLIQLDQRDLRSIRRIFFGANWSADLERGDDSSPLLQVNSTSEIQRTNTKDWTTGIDIWTLTNINSPMITELSPHSFTPMPFGSTVPQHYPSFQINIPYNAAAAFIIADSVEDEVGQQGKGTSESTEIFPALQLPANPWLRTALKEIDFVEQEAGEEGIEPPTEIAKSKAREILEAVASPKHKFPIPTVYAAEDGAIAIIFQRKAIKSSILVLCDSVGGGACFSYILGKKGRARIDDASDLPTAFLLTQLKRLALS